MTIGKNEMFRQFRTLLILGRVSNLPTVWSNCLASWIIGGGELQFKFLLACLGATSLYTGGMFLNDAIDSEFDRQHRRERPIPSGAIQARAVWIWGLSFLVLGICILSSFGRSTAILALILAGTIVLYDAIHKAITFSPILMAACRFWLFVCVASATPNGVTGLTIWSALVLSSYIVGLSYIAREESLRGPLRYWPCYFLGFPIVLAWLVNTDDYRPRVMLFSSIFLGWVVYSLLHSLWKSQRNIGRTVSGLLAGIVFVDWLAVAIVPFDLGLVFAIFFGLAVLFQKFIPAT